MSSRENGLLQLGPMMRLDSDGDSTKRKLKTQALKFHLHYDTRHDNIHLKHKFHHQFSETRAEKTNHSFESVRENMGWIRRRPNRTWSKTILESPELERVHMSTTTELSHAAQDICELWSSCITSNACMHDNKSGCLVIRRTSILDVGIFQHSLCPFHWCYTLVPFHPKRREIFFQYKFQRKEHTNGASTLSFFSYQP